MKYNKIGWSWGDKLHQSFSKSNTWVHDMLKVINFLNCHTREFFKKYIHEPHLFSLSRWSNLKENVFKTALRCFWFHMFSILWFGIFLQIINWSLSPAFSCSPSQIIKVEKTLKRRAKIETLHQIDLNVFVLWNSKKCGYLFMQK